MYQGGIVKIFNIFGFIPSCWMFNSVEPRNTDQSHVNQYIYYSTEIKSKLVKNQRNRFTYLQYSKKIYISRVPSVNKLSSRCKRIALGLHSLLINKGFLRVVS